MDANETAMKECLDLKPKINKDLLIYTSICDDDPAENGYKISANIGYEGEYYGASLTKAGNIITDSEEWIFKTLYMNLKAMIEAKTLWIGLTDEVIEFRKKYISEIPTEDYEIIVSLIEQAKELGFYGESK